MFMGEYRHSLDAKGRLIIPAKFREDLGDKFVITRSLDKCLNIYDMKSWEAFTEGLQHLPYNAKKQRDIVRFFLSGAVEVEPDKQGRVMLPGSLREKAGITEDVVFLGCGRYGEIWGREQYEVYENELSVDEIDEIAEEMLGGGFTF